MEIKSIEFIKGIVGTDEILEDGKPQVAFVGRSNVGKSSVINSLLGSKNIARSSSTPGRTKEINFFLVNGDSYFVDLPGYGYAKISQKQREKIRKMIMWYLQFSGAVPKAVVLIIDAKVGLKEFDFQMIELLKEVGHNFFVVANKADKLNQKETEKQKKEILEKIPENNVIFYSAKTGKGKEKVLDLI